MSCQDNNRQPIVLLVAVAVFAISLTAPLVKLVEAPAASAAGYRMLFATVIIVAWAVLKRHSLRDIDLRSLGFACLGGALLGFHFIAWFSSLDYTSVASSVTLATMQPLFSFIIGYCLYQERINFTAGIGTAIAVTGGVVIGWGDFRVSGMALWGDFLALFAAGLATVYFYIGQKVLKKVPLVTYTFYCYGFAATVILIYCLAVGDSIWNISSNDLSLFVLLAVFPTIFGHSILNFCTRRISVSSISMAMLCEPLGASLLAFMILGSIPTSTQVLGASLTLFGVYIFVKHQNKRRLV